MALWKVALWIVAIVIADHYLGGARPTINAALPATVLGVYPQSSGWLYLVDLTFGLALVAYSEEIIFRRCARYTLKSYLSDGYAKVVAGIGRTRLGHRTLKSVLTIGTRSAQSIMASGHIGRTNWPDT